MIPPLEPLLTWRCDRPGCCYWIRDMPLAVPAFGWGQWSDAATHIPPAAYLARWNSGFAVYPGDGKEQRYAEWAR